MSEPRVIKRYANRKLYDTQSSQYVTLEQIAQMIRIGEEVKVLDNASKEDLTSVTLAQIIFEEEKRQKSFIPLGAMRHLIQTGGASLSELAQQAQARVLSVFRKNEEGGRAEGDPALGEGLEPLGVTASGIGAGQGAAMPSAGTPRTAAAAMAPGLDGQSGAMRDFLERSQQTLEEWQRRADDRIRHMFESLSPFASLEKEVARLRERVDLLEQKLTGQVTPSAEE